MSESPRLVAVGTINGGTTTIEADVTTIGSDISVSVLLGVDYLMLDPPGFPFRPSFTGAGTPQFPHVVPAGSTIAVLRAEANALIAANAGALI
jgi:hypothetical protein